MNIYLHRRVGTWFVPTRSGLKFLTNVLCSTNVSGGHKKTCPPYKIATILALIGFLLLTIAASFRSGIATPTASALMTDRNGEFMAELESTGFDGYGFWPLKDLPQPVATATLALEDQHFWVHPGVDPGAVGRAFWQNISHQQRISGASTLAMQLVRLQHPASRSYFNKAIEALAAVIMTARYGREAVLANYLRWVPYGNRIHGIAYAARRYLDKPVEDLSWAEIAFLAAIPQSPSLMNPFIPSGRYRAVQRGKRLLQLLRDKQVISEAELSLALSEINSIDLPQKEKRPHNAMHAILKMEQHLKAATTTNATPYLKSSIDLALQDKFTDFSHRLLQRWRRQGAGNVGLIVLDRKSNEVLAWIGSDDYFDTANGGAIDYTQIQRSSGSTLKPFIYAWALERGAITANTVIDDLPLAGYPFRNSDYRFLGPMLPRQALANSRNIPAIRVLNKVGLDETYGLFARLKLQDYQFPASHYGQGIALGSLDVSLEELVRAYSVLANEGRFRDLRWVSQQGAGQSTDQGKQIFSAATARLVTLFLSDPSARLPTFPRMGTTEYPFPVALKTGTSQGERDAWTVAYSNQYIVGAWVGDAVPSPMYKLSGAGSAAQLVQQVLRYLHGKQRQGLADLSFPAPDHYVAVNVCASSGKLAGPACDQAYQEWLPAGQTPHDVDNSYVRLTVDSRSGLPADATTPAQYKRLQTMVNLPAQYAQWISQNQLVAYRKASLQQTEQQPKTVTQTFSVGISITSPQNELHILRNPETPDDSSSIALNAVVDPPVAQLVWYVDNEPYKLVDYPYATRLPLKPGKHRVQARVPLTPERSNTVVFYVE